MQKTIVWSIEKIYHVLRTDSRGFSDFVRIVSCMREKKRCYFFLCFHKLTFGKQTKFLEKSFFAMINMI